MIRPQLLTATDKHRAAFAFTIVRHCFAYHSLFIMDNRISGATRFFHAWRWLFQQGARFVITRPRSCKIPRRIRRWPYHGPPGWQGDISVARYRAKRTRSKHSPEK